MTWILIIFFGYRGGIGVVEFNTQQACEEAASTIVRRIDPQYAGKLDSKSLICVRKGMP